MRATNQSPKFSRGILMTLTLMTIAGSAMGQVRGRIEHIGHLPDEDPSIPTNPASSGNAINEFGQIAGGSAISGGTIFDGMVAMSEVVLPHAMLVTGDEVIDLGSVVPDPGPGNGRRPSTIAWGLNDQTFCVGVTEFFEVPRRRPFIWVPDESGVLEPGINELPHFGSGAIANDINNERVIVGEIFVPGDSSAKAAIWTPEGDSFSVTNLGTLGGNSSTLVRVNQRGEGIGFSHLGGSAQTSMIYLPKPAYGLPAGVSDLTPGIGNDFARDINEKGEVVGGIQGMPMLWLPESAYGLDAGINAIPVDAIATPEVLASIGAISFQRASFKAINNDGIAVGSATFGFPAPSGDVFFGDHAIIWVEGELRLLQTLVEESAWQRLTFANSINDDGVITGLGADPSGFGVGYRVTLLSGCLADFDGNGSLDFFDVSLFLSAMSAQDPIADLNSDGVFDFFDISTFLDAIAAGCP
jgi:uncharacterized membrane protein